MFILIVNDQLPDNLNSNELMHKYSSDRFLSSPPQLRINEQQIQSIPPGCQKQRITGIFTLQIMTSYLNTMRQSLLFRCKLWGMEGNGIILQEGHQNQRLINLNIRSTLENITKYFKDMKVICIDILQATLKQPTPSLQSKTVTSHYKQIGWIFVNPQRYIINHVLNDFEQVVSIMDSRKQKIGEANVKLSIQMYKTEELFMHPTQPNIAKPDLIAQKQLGKGENKQDSLKGLKPNRDDNNYKPQKAENYVQERRYRPSVEEQSCEEESTDKVQDRRLKIREEQFLLEFKRKSRAQQFLQQYSKNKPKHSELSLIRQKYGCNNPSVEVMKLKYDEVQLLSNVSEDNIKEEPRINLLLKAIKLQSKTKLDSLTIYCEQRRQKLKTQTKIMLNQAAANQRIQINYLYMLPNETTDVLVFDIKEGKAQVQVKSLTKGDRVEIKNKNNKRIATIEYTPISNKVIVENSTKIKRQRVNIDDLKASNQGRGQSKGKKQKQSAYISVVNWAEHRISMRNKNFGTTSASKLLFDVKQPQLDTVEVLLQNSKRQVVYLEVKIGNLFKEQNYVIEGKQVKIISSRGALNDVLGLIDRLEPQRLQPQQKLPTEHNQQPQNHQQIQQLKELTNIFQHLSQSQNIQCNELIQQLTSLPTISIPKLEKLSTAILVQSTSFLKALDHYFSSDFGQFFTMFQIYHKWNHKYHRSLRKIKRLLLHSSGQSSLLQLVKKIKKSKDILFGAISSSAFLSYFSKPDPVNDKSGGQNLQFEFDNESLGRLLILHFERYFNTSIKISQLQQFIEDGLELVNLNAYLLLKMSFEIRNELETYNDILDKQQLQFVNMFGLEKQMTGQLGLSKLLLAMEEQITQSSVISIHSAYQRRETERLDHLRTEREQHLKTQRSKEPLQRYQQAQRQHSKESEPGRIDTVQREQQLQEARHQQQKTIPIIITDVSIPNLTAIDIVKISNIHSSLQLNHEELFFPKAIVLAQDQLYKVEVEGDKKLWEGVFVAIKQPQTVLLYLNGEQNGRMYLFDRGRNATEQQQVPFKLITAHRPIIQDQNINLAEIPSNESSTIFQNLNRAKSARVKLTIRCIRPSRRLFQLKVWPCSMEGQQSIINYPNQNQVVLQNSDEGWRVGLLGSDFEEITLQNYVTSSTYWFANKTDKKVQYLVIIELAQHWNQQPEIKHQESLRLFCHLDTIIAIEPITPGNYDVILQNQKQLTNIATFRHDKPPKTLRLQTCFEIQRVGSPLTIKIINNRTQNLFAEFQFTTKAVAAPLSKSHRYLIASHPGHRLEITLFQLNHSWHHVKPDRIFSLFNSPAHKQTIESYLKSYGISNQQELITWLKNNFELALGQIDIMLNELFEEGEEASWRQFLNIFRGTKIDDRIDVSQVMDEFRIFDLKEEGLISLQQMKLIKKILDRNFTEVSKLLSNLQSLFVTSPQKDDNCIIDLNAPSSEFDYLSFIALISLYEQAEKPKPKSALPSFQKHQRPSKYLQVKLLSFNRLSINGAPSTLLFKISGKRLADPVHRCYSHTYSNSEEITIENDRSSLLEIYCQKLNTEGLWEYKLIESVQLQRQIKILGGTIQLQITESEDPVIKQQKRWAKEDVNDSNLQVSPIHKRAQQKQQDRLQRSGFQKSFWNKSLHQTRQQWSKANATGTGFKERRKMLELKQQQIRKKMSLFDKFYEE